MAANNRFFFVSTRISLTNLVFELINCQAGNQAISVFSGQKYCTRIMLYILKSFLHYLKAKAVNNCQGSRLREIVKFHHQCHFTTTLKCFI